jgi:hypothetical protein
MLFNIEADRGAEIVAYLVPDNPAEPARLRVLGGGRVLWEGPANEMRAALVEAGRHRTGACGFRIGPALVAGLERHPDLELRCSSTDLCVWRRGADRPRLQRKVFRLETSLVRRVAFDAAMERLFQAWHVGVDRFGHETASQCFLQGPVASVYVSGRLHLPNYAYMIDRGFASLATIRDPYHELAERVIVLSGGRGPVGGHLVERDRMVYGPAIEALAGLDGADPDAVRRRFRRLGRESAAALSNPVARLLAATRPDELCGADAASTALRALSGFAVVAVDEAEGWFETAVADVLGAGVELGRSRAATEGMDALAAALIDVPVVEAMLEVDLEVHDAVAALLARVSPPKDGGADGSTA